MLKIVDNYFIINDEVIAMAKINISMPSKILEEIDKVSKAENMSRSELLRNAFKAYREIVEEKKKEKKRQKSIDNAIQLQDEIRKKIGNANLIEDLRKWREGRR